MTESFIYFIGGPADLTKQNCGTAKPQHYYRVAVTPVSPTKDELLDRLEDPSDKVPAVIYQRIVGTGFGHIYEFYGMED